MDDRISDYGEDNKISEFNEYRRTNTKENKSTNINRIIKQTSASPNSFIPLSTTHKIEKISNFNYSNANLSSNYSKRDSSKDKFKLETVSLRPNNLIPETTKSPIKIFSPSNKALVLTTKNKYSNISNKIESFFNKKEFEVSRKSISPRRNILDEPRPIHLDIKSVDKVKPVFNYKNRQNTLKVYTKATSPNYETPRNMNDTNKIIRSTKNKSNDYLSNDATFLKDRVNHLKEKIFKFCKNNNVEINEVIMLFIRSTRILYSNVGMIITDLK